MIKPWDKFIRTFHWAVALLFIMNYFFLEAGDGTHEWAGYALFAFVVARILWGFIGPEPARFKKFWQSWLYSLA